MSVTREEIAAFADGELDPERQAIVAAAVAADPALAEQVRAHRTLRDRLGTHFAPMLTAPLPERLTAPLRATAQVANLAAAREERERARRLPRWSWLAGPALAATIALAVFVRRDNQQQYVSGKLATSLDQQLVAMQAPDRPIQILLSFRDQQGTYCRAFAAETQSGIACRDAGGWRLRVAGPGARAQEGEYRMAGSDTAALLEEAQSMAAGPALDDRQEAAARTRGWR